MEGCSVKIAKCQIFFEGNGVFSVCICQTTSLSEKGHSLGMYFRREGCVPVTFCLNNFTGSLLWEADPSNNPTGVT